MKDTKIVIIDDDLDFSKALRVTLESEQYTVLVANERTEGMEKIKSEKPDLAILDVMMSTWQDGFEMARELKKEPGLEEMRILMLTGVEEKTGIEFKSTAGDPTWCPVDGFLNKPVESDILLAEVRKILSQKD